MLKRLRLKNFQPHEDLKIKFDQITTIVGPTDSGKTSLMRALGWVTFNRPRGDAFLRDGAEEVSAYLWLDDSAKVARIRGKENAYQLNGSIFKAVGTDVPIEVSEALKLSEINFQRQHDAPFWFSLTPGEVAKQLNEIVDLSIMDDVMAEIAKRLRHERSKEAVLVERVQLAEEHLAKIDFVPQLVEDWKELKEAQEQFREKGDVHLHITAIIDSLQNLAELERELMKMIDDAQQVVNQGLEWIDLDDEKERLDTLIDKCEVADNKANQPIPDLCSIDMALIQATNDFESLSNLNASIERLSREETTMQSLSVRLTKAQDRMDEISKIACPECGRLYDG